MQPDMHTCRKVFESRQVSVLQRPDGETQQTCTLCSRGSNKIWEQVTWEAVAYFFSGHGPELASSSRSWQKGRPGDQTSPSVHTLCLAQKDQKGVQDTLFFLDRDLDKEQGQD